MMWKEREFLVRKLVEECNSKKELLERLGLGANNGNYGKLSQYMKIWGLDHITIPRRLGGRKRFIKLSDEAFFAKETSRNGANLMNRLVKLGWDKSCRICGISKWRGAELTLHVDHIDGEKTNNSLTNLRILCPNCHQQTATWGNKKVKKCKKCGKKFSGRSSSKHCSDKCIKETRAENLELMQKSNIGKTRIHFPEIAELINLIREENFVKVAGAMGCSDNAIRKHLVRNGYSPKTLGKLE